MLISAIELYGKEILANDGFIGNVYDFKFDETWTIRYLVVDPGEWLPGRKVLVSPDSLGKPDWKTEALTVNLTKDVIKNSPHIEEDKPISRLEEMKHHDYYGLIPYWSSIGTGLTPPLNLVGPVSFSEREKKTSEVNAKISLRGMREIMSYHIEASDGDIGHFQDFIVTDEKLIIKYVTVDTGNGLPGKKVLVSPEWIKSVIWGKRKVFVDLTQEQIKNSPDCDSLCLSTENSK